MKTPSDRLSQEHQKGSGTQTPTGLRLKVKRAAQEELAEISPAFRILQKHEVEQPTSTQWRNFSRTLTERLDREAEKHRRYRSVQVIRDEFTATDSIVMRTVGYALLILALGAIAVGIYAAAALAFNAPMPQTSFHIENAPAVQVAMAAQQVAPFART